MIFVTIGTQEPFERLIRAIDEIAPTLGEPVFVQTLQPVQYVKNVRVLNFLSPNEFETYFNDAKLIISHAGMGTIISALVIGKPILVMPRLLKYHEHRNEHQLATAKKFDALGYIHVAYNENELKTKTVELLNNGLMPMHKIGDSASSQLVNSLKDFIEKKNSASFRAL